MNIFKTIGKYILLMGAWLVLVSFFDPGLFFIGISFIFL